MSSLSTTDLARITRTVGGSAVDSLHFHGGQIKGRVGQRLPGGTALIGAQPATWALDGTRTGNPIPAQGKGNLDLTPLSK